MNWAEMIISMTQCKFVDLQQQCTAFVSNGLMKAKLTIKICWQETLITDFLSR